ncbi:unnamed protein product [Symbiodinium sp. CCMP2592]|nr:unnamed protein product [Symbiodinium sp. CCMP2592]
MQAQAVQAVQAVAEDSQDKEREAFVQIPGEWLPQHLREPHEQEQEQQEATDANVKGGRKAEETEAKALALFFS